MCVPPCDAGVKPIPPMPASRPLCMRISETRTKTSRTWKTARTLVTVPRVTAEGRGRRAGALRPPCYFYDRVDQLGRDPVLRHVPGCAGLAGAVDVVAGVRSREHE